MKFLQRLRWVVLLLYVLVSAWLMHGFLLAGSPLAVVVGLTVVTQLLFLRGGGSTRSPHDVKRPRPLVPVVVVSFMGAVLTVALFFAVVDLPGGVSAAFENVFQAIERSGVDPFLVILGIVPLAWFGSGILFFLLCRRVGLYRGLLRLGLILLAASIVALFVSYYCFKRTPLGSDWQGAGPLIAIFACGYVFLWAFVSLTLLVLFLQPKGRSGPQRGTDNCSRAVGKRLADWLCAIPLAGFLKG